MTLCDHNVSGVIIAGSSHPGLLGEEGYYLMLRRLTPPVGIAPVAGHVDGHGGILAAAHAEAKEEANVELVGITPIVSRAWRANWCRRTPIGPHMGHEWTVIRAHAKGDLQPEEGKTADLTWYSRQEVEELAARTQLLAEGRLTYDEFAAKPGLEPIWIEWFIIEGAISASAIDLNAIAKLAQTPPPGR